MPNTDDMSDNPPSASTAQPISVFSGQARVLVEALRRKSAKSERAIGMYREALRAIARNDGPECLHVAAYELREFMNALPRALDLPILDYEQLMSKVQSFVKDWRVQATKSDCLKADSWEGTIDGALRNLLKSNEVFVAWVEEQAPSRRAEASLVLEKLAPTGNPLPSSLMRMRTDDWSGLLRYFNQGTHHDSEPDPVEFTLNVGRLETFLLDHLEPRTFEDQTEIDRLISEVEADDNP